MNTISDKVLNKIKKEQIKPLPIWQFRLRDSGQWIGLGLFILLIISALGLLWYFWSDGPWVHGGRLGFGLFFGRMPLLLLSVIIIGGGLALFDFRNIGRGYRYSVLKITLSLLLLGLILGGSLNYFGASQRMDSFFSASPLYQNREAYMKDMWQRPNEGLLAGEIIKIQDDNNFSFQDFDGRTWTVDASKALWRHDLRAEINLRVKLIGTMDGNNFIVQEVRPWLMSGGCAVMESAGACQMMK
ncbi:hypothetical protein L6270_04930 [Candidatus Parcubacteria bacterium]|nr:hypothetical protein [Patescibacteria group bacterium]MBU4309305.1 hypothetical protein [Patescibacteria group bacterium]MBU4432282.1 hypothetical protein [Patescibacteria group bacterium]MBU4577666.1 hypothetical protein [Patescibacteria group bacterium]MCG2697352.1 hypothetical protein [Candidatus Parcubacteria bacterium]